MGLVSSAGLVISRAPTRRYFHLIDEAAASGEALEEPKLGVAYARFQAGLARYNLRDAAAEIVLSVSSPSRSPSPNALGRHAILGTATPGSASGSPLKNRRSPVGRSPLATLDA